MIATINKQPAFAPLHDVKLIGLRDREAQEFHEYVFVFENGMIKCHNTQFRLVLDQDHPNYHDLVKSGHALDWTRFAAKRVRELQEVSAKGTVGTFHQPTLYAITNEEVVLDYTEIARRTTEVLDNHSVVDAMRSPATGKVSVEADGNDSVITIVSEGQQDRRIKFLLPTGDIEIRPEVGVSEPLFSFAPTASDASRRWVADKIGRSATERINGQVAYDIDLLMRIPDESFLWFDARKNSRFFSMPARWSSRHIRFETKSPHRTTALRAAGITVG